MKKQLLLLPLLCSCLYTPVQAQNNDLQLPKLGDSVSGVLSARQEQALGQAWLRAFRSQAPLQNDPLLYEFTESLIYRLSTHSQLQDRRLELVVVDNGTLNAFAVPGGIVGVHTGLFVHAETEAQFASVITHELAHLSQRHAARGLEASRRNSLPLMAAMLASLVLAATTGSDAGLAALTATQAAALDAQLRYSRQHESEADRIGLQNLAKAGVDPRAAAEMFEQMLRATRYSSKPLEFLLTHPLTEKRIADARNRASQFPQVVPNGDFDYQLMRARARLSLEANPSMAVKRFLSERESQYPSADVANYGLALAWLRNQQPEKAEPLIANLLDKYPGKMTFLLAKADLLNAEGRYAEASALLDEQLQLNPGNHPLTVTYAETLLKQGAIEPAQQLLEDHSRRKPNDPHIWYLLAEVQGLAGNIVGVHTARAEYFMLNGNFLQARRQLGYAVRLTANDYPMKEKLKRRIADVEALEKKTEF